jgi:hypothetical protein
VVQTPGIAETERKAARRERDKFLRINIIQYM